MAQAPEPLPAAPDRRLIGAIRTLGVLTMVLIAAGALLVAFRAPILPGLDSPACPACFTSPVGQKIMYYHVPSAFAAYGAFLLLAIASYRVLGTDGRSRWDAVAVAASEVGVLFAGLTLFTGSMWGHLEWGRYWDTAEMKLMLTLVMFLVYVAYLVLRRQVDDPRRRARVAAVYGLLGFATVPLSYLAQRLWPRFHPAAAPWDAGGVVTPGVREALYGNALAILAAAAFLILVRYRIELTRRNPTAEAEAA